MFGRQNKKPAKSQALSCPFCGLAFEDVTLHLDSCSGVPSSQPKQQPPTPSTPEPIITPKKLPEPPVPSLPSSSSQPKPPISSKPLPEPPSLQTQSSLPVLPLKPIIEAKPALPEKPQQTRLSNSLSLKPRPNPKPPLSPKPLPDTPNLQAQLTAPILPSKPLPEPKPTPPLEAKPAVPEKPQTQEYSPPVYDNNIKEELLRPKIPLNKSRDAQNESPKSSPRIPPLISPRVSREIKQEETANWAKSSGNQTRPRSKFITEEENPNSNSIGRSNSYDKSENSENSIDNDDEEFGDEDMAKVIYDYNKENEGEIELKAGDIVAVLDTSNPEWFYIRKEGDFGYVASNYLEPLNFTPGENNILNNNENLKTEENKQEEVVVRTRKPTTPTPVIQPSSIANRPTRESKGKSKFLSIKTFAKGGKKNSSSDFTISRNEEFTISRNDNASGNSDQNINTQNEVPSSPSVDDKVDQRTKIAREILSTEQHYIRVLKALEENYKQKLMEKVSNESYGKGDLKVTIDNLKDIFVNINMILPFNLQLVSELEKCLSNWNEQSIIADIFVKLAPFLKMYNQYSNSYDNALVVLAKCIKVEKFALLVEECDATTGLSARLDSLLIAPIQRIPRYTLLLSEIKKHTPEGHPDQVNLDKAIPLLQEVADYINKNILLAENRAKLLSLSMAGAQSLLKPHRILLHEFVLVEKKSKLHLWLFNDILVQLSETKAKDKRNLNDPKNQWPLHLIWIEKKPKNNFSLVGPTARYILTSQLPEEADKWMNNILKVLEQHFEYLSVTQDLDLQKEKEANMKAESLSRYGTYEFPTGETFSGWWNDGKFEGAGKFSFFGSTYVGNFKDGLKDGSGEFTYFNGSVYEGDWLNDKPHGQGTLRYPNGDVYIGPWRDGKRAGKGEFRALAGDSYIGEWADDVPEGLGEMYYKNGDVYNGNWHAGLRSHYGILVNKDGTRYEGEWVAGVKNGKGRMEYAENFFYNGYWKEGMYNGQGKLVAPGGTYDGEWVADLKEGNGNFTFPNGCVYKGQWKKNVYHGTGTLIYSAGIVESFVGEFANHRKNGSGVLKYFNGDSYDGHFKENMFHGTGTFTWADGSYLKSKWTKGKASGESTFGKGKDKSMIIHGILKEGILSAEGKPNIFLPNLPPISMDM